MSITLAFGSASDILSVAQLTYKIAKALSESAGASQEYQDLIHELDIFELGLKEVREFLSPHNPTRLQPSAENAIRRIVALCNEKLKQFSQDIMRYRESLRKGGSKNMVVDSWRKIGWSLFGKEDLVKLRKTLSCHRQNIMWIFILSGFRSTKLLELELKSQDELQKEFSRIPLLAGESVRPVRELGYGWRTDLKPLRLLDAFGSRIDIPVEFCTTYADFWELMRFYFRGKPGQKKIEEGQFHITLLREERGIGPGDWEALVCPGTELAMSIVIPNAECLLKKYQCPASSCWYVNTELAGISGGIKCRRCSTWFSETSVVDGKRITELPETGMDLPRRTSREERSKVEDEHIFFRRFHLIRQESEPVVMEHHSYMRNILALVELVCDLAEPLEFRIPRFTPNKE